MPLLRLLADDGLQRVARRHRLGQLLGEVLVPCEEVEGRSKQRHVQPVGEEALDQRVRLCARPHAPGEVLEPGSRGERSAARQAAERTVLPPHRQDLALERAEPRRHRNHRAPARSMLLRIVCRGSLGLAALADRRGRATLQQELDQCRLAHDGGQHQRRPASPVALRERWRVCGLRQGKRVLPAPGADRRVQLRIRTPPAACDDRHGGATRDDRAETGSWSFPAEDRAFKNRDRESR